MSLDVTHLGQVFTPPALVAAMLALRENHRRILEPACGDGAFLSRLPDAVGIEIDARQCPADALNLDFFAYPASEKFATIIGNPPYVRFQDIPVETRALLPATQLRRFDSRSNLYLFFIDKALDHLEPDGELIFVTPRDFLKASGAVKLNRRLYELGTITHAIELGDARVFEGAVPNCLIWRFQAGDFSRRTRFAAIGAGADIATALAAPNWETREFLECAGHLMFARGAHPLRLADIASVKVGAVSGADEIYVDSHYGNRDFVCSTTVATGKTRRMIWCEPGHPPPRALWPHKERLIARRVQPFDESNWWQWGRGYPQSDAPRVYVNGRTRRPSPFFTHPSTHFDGAVLAIFPHDRSVDVAALAAALNRVDWDELGFVCDGRFLFTQRSLENAPLPAEFGRFRDSLNKAVTPAKPGVQMLENTGFRLSPE